jgi:hypothetical protein
MNKTASDNEKMTGINKTLEIEVEELEAKIAPSKGINLNHNETLVRDAEVNESVIEIEELEAIVAPYIGVRPNHNETLVRDID